ncbi:hypothetical protein [Nonomuraea solani]|nr:hypothetical protein [Nonomuraea solani]
MTASGAGRAGDDEFTHMAGLGQAGVGDEDVGLALPTLIVFQLPHERFVAGLTLGATKGRTGPP